LLIAIFPAARKLCLFGHRVILERSEESRIFFFAGLYRGADRYARGFSLAVATAAQY
jgi:hypothetical protein